MMDLISQGADENLIVATMGIDQSSAFDCVDWNTFKDKLQYYGLDRTTTDWLDSYLQYRSAYVSIGTENSDMWEIRHGVPQGSVIGPLIFLIYTNEFGMVVENELCQDPAHRNQTKLFTKDCNVCAKLPIFADDAEMILTGRNRRDMQDTIDDNFIKIKDFLNSNGLEINEGKMNLTEFLLKQKRSRLKGIPPELTASEKIVDKRTGTVKIRDKHVTDSKYCKVLGLTLQNDLTWDGHLSRGKKPLIPALRSQIGVLSKVGKFMSCKARLQVMNALVISRLSYGISIWGNTTANQTRKGQIVLNMAARFITGKARTTKAAETNG